MSKLHCMCGYIWFGKTTIAKQLAKQYKAVRITPDELMIKLFGTDVKSDFMEKANKVNTYIWNKIKKCTKKGQDVIYDAGSWSVNDRKYIMDQAANLNVEVVWHQIVCSIDTAKNGHLIVPKESKSYLLMSVFLIKIYLGIHQFLIQKS